MTGGGGAEHCAARCGHRASRRAGEPGCEEAVWLGAHIALRRFDALRGAFQAALRVRPHAEATRRRPQAGTLHARRPFQRVAGARWRRRCRRPR